MASLLPLVRLQQNRTGSLALKVLAFLYAAALFADFIGPYDEGSSNRDKFYHPPTRIHWRDEDGRFARPYVYNYVPVGSSSQRYVPVPTLGKFPVRLFHRGEAYRLLWLIPTNTRLVGVDRPAVLYLLGGDKLGRDVFSRLLHGGRRSLFLSMFGVTVGSMLGTLCGCVAGHYGGKIDNVLMRFAEIVQSVPSLYLLIAVGAVLPGDLPSSVRYFFITITLSLIGWAGMSRVVRAAVLSIRRQGFVEAAFAIGASPAHIIMRHILPNAMSSIVISTTLKIPGFMLGEASLSFLGLGIQEPLASWGSMLSDATNIVAIRHFPWMLVPGIVICLNVLCWNFVGDAVRDAFDSRSASRHRQ